MSDQPQTRPKVPDGKSESLITRQMEPDAKGFVGYETIYEPVQKVVDYVTPKRP